MKLNLRKPGKKVILVSSVIALGLVGGISAQVVNKPQVSAGSSPLIKEVANQGTELDNHEARITNTESDVKDLQGKTNTAPSTVQLPVPVVVSSPAANSITPAAQAAPTVTVTGYKEIAVDTNTTDCEYSYSDGTTHRFQWKVVNPHGSWADNSVGGPGYWLATTSTNGFCDYRAIGNEKA